MDSEELAHEEANKVIMRPWQKVLEDELQGPADSRKVIVYVYPVYPIEENRSSRTSIEPSIQKLSCVTKKDGVLTLSM